MDDRNQLRRFVRRLAVFAVLNLCLFAAVMVRLHHRSQQYILATIDKERRLATAPDPRIIFIGGSNLAFALDSTIIEENLDLNAVNMGVYVNVGLDYMLKQADAGLRKGDLVVLSLEYDIFWWEPTRLGNMTNWMEIILINPTDIRYMAPRHFWYAISRTQNSFGMISMLLGEAALADPPENNHPYQRASFNHLGDNVYPRTGNVRWEEKHTIAVIREAEYRAACIRVQEYTKRWAMKGVKVCMVMPAFPEQDVPANQVALQELERRFTQDLGLPIVLGVDEAPLPTELFYDTPLHLTTDGVRRRSLLLADRLKVYLDSSKTDQ